MAGIGHLHLIDGIMDQDVFLDVVKKNVKKSAEKLNIEREFCISARQSWLLYHALRQLKTPPRSPKSPKLIPIEHFWDELGRPVTKLNIKSNTCFHYITF